MDNKKKKMYKLIGKDGIPYFSETKGLFGGHRQLKIYGLMDCPSALRHIEQGNYIKHRVFFADEETAISAGYRPCGICMKEHYELWKRGKFMNHALTVSPILNETYICSVQLADGTIRYFSAEQLKGSQIVEKFKDGIEYYQMTIIEDNCVIILLSESFQWGYTLVWDYTKDKLVHMTTTPYVVSSTLFNEKVINMYLIQYWGHPADLWYSITPVQMIDSEYEPEKIPLNIQVDETISDITSCKVCIENGKMVFRAGTQSECVEIKS